MNAQATLHELTPIARNMRERQLAIDAAARKSIGDMSTIIALIQEQGRDVIEVKTHLGKLFTFGEWLENHVPSLTPKTAAKYERITTEQLEDVRQCVFAFLPEPERKPLPERTPPKPWEACYAYVYRLRNRLNDDPITEWPANQVECIREEVEPIARQLWPEKFAQNGL